MGPGRQAHATHRFVGALEPCEPHIHWYRFMYTYTMQNIYINPPAHEHGCITHEYMRTYMRTCMGVPPQTRQLTNNSTRHPGTSLGRCHEAGGCKGCQQHHRSSGEDGRQQTKLAPQGRRGGWMEGYSCDVWMTFGYSSNIKWNNIHQIFQWNDIHQISNGMIFTTMPERNGGLPHQISIGRGAKSEYWRPWLAKSFSSSIEASGKIPLKL